MNAPKTDKPPLTEPAPLPAPENETYLTGIAMPLGEAVVQMTLGGQPAYGILQRSRAFTEQSDFFRVQFRGYARQADGRWTNEFKRSENAAGEPVFWLAGAFENAKPIHADNDTLALDSGYASLVPCKIDVTDYDFLAVLKNQLKVES